MWYKSWNPQCLGPPSPNPVFKFKASEWFRPWYMTKGVSFSVLGIIYPCNLKEFTEDEVPQYSILRMRLCYSHRASSWIPLLLRLKLRSYQSNSCMFVSSWISVKLTIRNPWLWVCSLGRQGSRLQTLLLEGPVQAYLLQEAPYPQLVVYSAFTRIIYFFPFTPSPKVSFLLPFSASPFEIDFAARPICLWAKPQDTECPKYSYCCQNTSYCCHNTGALTENTKEY